MPTEIQCAEKTVREINQEIKASIASGETSIRVLEPGARHNLGVALTTPVEVSFDGSVGYYCGGLIDAAHIKISGSAGWGVGESKLGGEIIVEGNAGNGAGAAMRGGLLVIKGNASSRAGISFKGGVLVIGGDCGYMTGFMGQKGTIIIGGDSGEALADSMYETEIFVGGTIKDLGNDAVIEAPTETDLLMLQITLEAHGMDWKRDWKKVVSGRQMWNFNKDAAVWREVL